MSRDVQEVLQSGYLTEAEKQAMDFELALEANEERMGEHAAMAVTCEQFGVELEDHAYILIELPDGDWWEAENLPVRASTETE
jgi:hypothetical protein